MSFDRFVSVSTRLKRAERNMPYDLASTAKICLFVGMHSNQLRHQFEQSGILPTHDLIGLDHPEAIDAWRTDTAPPLEPIAIFCDASYSREKIYTLKYSFSKQELIPLILYSKDNRKEYYNKALAMMSISEDFLHEGLGLSNIKERMIFLSELKQIKEAERISAHPDNEGNSTNPGLSKRLFDIAVAGLIVMLISPLLLLIAVAIKLESRGPIFFIAKRAGAGYRVFDFYKFRTMRSDADQMRGHLKTLNTYYAKDRSDDQSEPFFFKVKNDPRVTRVGRVLRKTSLDELPQLFNVIKGDMSLVGNRPLPLDEGATLTIDRWADRFLAPAGMTGLWQIAKNKDNMSVTERIELDLAYVEHSSFSLDMKILLKTLPAMLQRE